MKYRTELAEKLIDTDDDVEPPHLFSSNVLRLAKYELQEKNYVHKNRLKHWKL